MEEEELISMSKIRTRFAPSPTGSMHVGNLRTALYEYLIAKHEDGDFILRIEDTDQERLVEGALDTIYNTLELTGLKADEGLIFLEVMALMFKQETKGRHISRTMPKTNR